VTTALIHPNSGKETGLGHLVRSLRLARELDRLGATVEILLNPDGPGEQRVRRLGFEPQTRPKSGEFDLGESDADIVVIDSYDVSGAAISRIHENHEVAVIDELGQREFTADVVVNNNVYAEDIDYPGADRVLRGPRYCMLREEFREVSIPREPDDRVLLTLGGSDLTDTFGLTLRTIRDGVSETTPIDAIVGPYFEERSLSGPNVTIHRDPDSLANLFAKASYAISGGGQTMYELAACGTPAITVEVGPDQRRNIRGLSDEGFCIPVGKPGKPEYRERLETAIEWFRDHPTERRAMAATGRALVDGDGAARVARELLEHS